MNRRFHDQMVRIGWIFVIQLRSLCGIAASATLVTRDRRIVRHEPVKLPLSIGHGLNLFEHATPNSIIGLPVEVLGDYVLVPKPLGHISLRRAGLKPPCSCIDNRPAIDRVVLHRPLPGPSGNSNPTADPSWSYITS